jgi:hypothetical protein
MTLTSFFRQPAERQIASLPVPRSVWLPDGEHIGAAQPRLSFDIRDTRALLHLTQGAIGRRPPELARILREDAPSASAGRSDDEPQHYRWPPRDRATRWRDGRLHRQVHFPRWSSGACKRDDGSDDRRRPGTGGRRLRFDMAERRDHATGRLSFAQRDYPFNHAYMYEFKGRANGQRTRDELTSIARCTASVACSHSRPG